MNLFGELLYGDELVCSLILIFSIKFNFSRRILILIDMLKKVEINKLKRSNINYKIILF